MITQLFQRLEEKYSQYQYYSITKLICVLLVLGLAISILLSELITLLSFSYVGIIESAISSQISILTFTYQGLELSPKTGDWVTVERNTMFEDFSEIHRVIWLVLSLSLLKLLKLNFVKKSLEKSSLLKSYFELKKITIKAVHLIDKKIVTPTKNQFEKEFGRRPIDAQKVELISHTTHCFDEDSNYMNEFRKIDDEGNERIEIECPFCAERILRKALLCKHCGKKIDAKPTIQMKIKKDNNKGTSRAANRNDKSRKRIIFIVLFVAVMGAIANFRGGSQSVYSSKISNNDARLLCGRYISKQFSRSLSSIRTEHIKYDGGHFVKAYYYRPSDNQRWDYVCSLIGGTIVWATLDNGSDLGRWRYEDAMKYSKNKKDGSLNLF